MLGMADLNLRHCAVLFINVEVSGTISAVTRCISLCCGGDIAGQIFAYRKLNNLDISLRS